MERKLVSFRQQAESKERLGHRLLVPLRHSQTLHLLLHRLTVQPLSLLPTLRTQGCDENKQRRCLSAVSGCLRGFLSKDAQPPTCRPGEGRSGNQSITSNCFLLSFASGVATADGLFMVNLGDAKVGPDSFHVISFKLQLNYISLYDDNSSMGSLSTKDDS